MAYSHLPVPPEPPKFGDWTHLPVPPEPPKFRGVTQSPPNAVGTRATSQLPSASTAPPNAASVSSKPVKPPKPNRRMRTF